MTMIQAMRGRTKIIALGLFFFWPIALVEAP